MKKYAWILLLVLPGLAFGTMMLPDLQDDDTSPGKHLLSGGAGGVPVWSDYPQTVAFESLGTPTNGTVVFCSDCVDGAPCAGEGAGALAFAANGLWICLGNSATTTTTTTSTTTTTV